MDRSVTMASQKYAPRSEIKTMRIFFLILLFCFTKFKFQALRQENKRVLFIHRQSVQVSFMGGLAPVVAIRYQFELELQAPW